jgi:hypothetical protein
MKKIILLTGVLFSLFTSYNAEAQVNVNVNLGRPVVQESWYASDKNYYYLPEQGVYYNVQRRAYIFPENGQWLYANRLPSRYGNYTYRSSQYVRISEPSPFKRDDVYRQKYYKGNNPKAQGRHDNGNHNGAYKSKTVIQTNKTQVNHRSGNAGHGNPGGGNRGNSKGGHGNGKK